MVSVSAEGGYINFTTNAVQGSIYITLKGLETPLDLSEGGTRYNSSPTFKADRLYAVGI